MNISIVVTNRNRCGSAGRPANLAVLDLILSNLIKRILSDQSEFGQMSRTCDRTCNCNFRSIPPTLVSHINMRIRARKEAEKHEVLIEFN